MHLDPVRRMAANVHFGILAIMDLQVFCVDVSNPYRYQLEELLRRRIRFQETRIGGDMLSIDREAEVAETRHRRSRILLLIRQSGEWHIEPRNILTRNKDAAEPERRPGIVECRFAGTDALNRIRDDG